VRGYDPDGALLGKSGWYARQELTGAPMFGNSVQSFAFLDLGQAGASNKRWAAWALACARVGRDST
jgi:hemolysin activation/secretion protein